MTDSAGFTTPLGPLTNVSGAQNNPNEKNSSEEYIHLERNEEDEQEDFRDSKYVDRSAQLRATLNSLASLNAASIINNKKQK